MLIALAKKKVSNDRAAREDIITSTVFGPLRYMEPTAVWRIVRCLLGPEAAFPGPPDADAWTDVCFWPREKVPGNETVCEPDLMIDFLRAGTYCARVIIEVKWDAPASGGDQLLRQKLAFGQGAMPCWHVYLTKHHLRAADEIENAGLCAENVINLPWSLLVSRLLKMDDDAPGDDLVNVWARDVRDAMDRLGIVSFSGFTGAVPTAVAPGAFSFFTAFSGFAEVVAALPRLGSCDFFMRNGGLQMENGALAVDAVRCVKNIGKQIEALVDVFAINLRREVADLAKHVDKPLGVTEGADGGPDPDWVYTRWHWNYIIAGGGAARKRYPSYLALDFVLEDDVTEKVVGKQPLIYVLCCSEGEFEDIEEDDFRLDASFLADEGYSLDVDGKLWYLNKDSEFYWVFCVPLFAVNNEHDVRDQLVLPAKRLIQAFRFNGSPVSTTDIQAALSTATRALSFEWQGDVITLRGAQAS